MRHYLALFDRSYYDPLYREFPDRIADIASKQAGIERLSEHVYMLPEDTLLIFVSAVAVQTAVHNQKGAHTCGYACLVCEGTPQWLRYDCLRE